MDALLKTLKAVAEPSRLRLLVLCAEGEYSVSELVYVLDQSQPRVSRHLKLLCDAGLLQNIREGSWMLYRFAPGKDAAALAELVLSLLPENDPFLVQDQKRLLDVKLQRSQAATDYFRFNADQWDKIRGLHVDEAKVEEAIQQIFLAEPIDKFLDIGTGTGRILELVGGHARQVDGLDQSREMLAVARDNLDQANLKNYTIRHGDMYQLPYSDNEYEAACLHQVLHFAEEPARVIAEAARVLRPGGKLVVVDFARHDLEDLRQTYHHRRLGFSDGEFVHWFQRNGLSFKSPLHLSGEPLTVVIWTGIKMRTDK